MKKISIKHLNNLHSDSLRGLDFYTQELGIMQERLEEITNDNTGREVLREVEHFQNQILIQRGHIDELKHELHANIHQMKQQLEAAPDFVSESSEIENEDLYQQYLTTEKIINELRKEFNRFAAKWM